MNQPPLAVNNGTLALWARRIDLVAIVSGHCIAWLIVPMVLSLCYEVVARYLFNAPTQWAYDMTFMLYGTSNGNAWTEVGRYGTICRRKILELAVPFKDLHLQAGQEFKLSVAILQNGMEVDRYPRQQPVNLIVPDDNYEAATWRV